MSRLPNGSRLAVGYQARHDDNAFVRALGVKSDDRTFTDGYPIHDLGQRHEKL